MRRGHWFTPEAPDVLRMLGRQVEVTRQGAEEFAAWAAGAGDGAHRVREAGSRGTRRSETCWKLFATRS